MNSRRRQKAETRRAIVRSPARLARRRGLAGMGIADAMADAGLTVGGFYAHFGSKQALADATIRFAVGKRSRSFGRAAVRHLAEQK